MASSAGGATRAVMMRMYSWDAPLAISSDSTLRMVPPAEAFLVAGRPALASGLGHLLSEGVYFWWSQTASAAT